MNTSKIIKNPWLLFSPFLVIYTILAIVFPTHGNAGDEIQYLELAHNLVHGFYSLPEPNTTLAVGPGYPILLMPFVALGLPLISMTIFNAILYYISIVLLFKSLLDFVSFRKALLFGLFWASYFDSFEFILLIHTEIFTAFLISMLVFFMLKACNPDPLRKTIKYVWLSGFTFGILILTKVIFGYIIVFMFFVIGILWLLNRPKVIYRRGATILLIAFVTTVPYLVYTYHLTGRIFYWSTAGGNNLYWMSNPNEGEYGDYFSFPDLRFTTDIISKNASDSLISHHQKDFDETKNLRGAELDDAFKKMAIANITSHPDKYAINLISNIGRIVFNTPYSYKLQNPRNLLRFPHNGLLIVLLAFSFIPTLTNWKRIPSIIQFIVFLLFFYFGLSVIGSAETRMLTVVIPALLIWIAYVIEKSVKISLTFNQD